MTTIIHFHLDLVHELALTLIQDAIHNEEAENTVLTNSAVIAVWRLN